MSLSKPGKLPYVTLYHNTNKYNFIVDTGSTLSWTTPQVASEMLLGKEVSVAEGFDYCKLNSAVRVTLRVSPMTFTEEDNIARKFQTTLFCGEATSKINEMNACVKEPVHGILGTDFLLDNILKIDINELTLRL